MIAMLEIKVKMDTDPIEISGDKFYYFDVEGMIQVGRNAHAFYLPRCTLVSAWNGLVFNHDTRDKFMKLPTWINQTYIQDAVWSHVVAILHSQEKSLNG